MAKFAVGKGLDGYLQALQENVARMPGTCGRAVYDGAKIIADAVHANIETLPLETSEWRSEDDKATGITKRQKQGLLDGFGIAKMHNDDGFYNVKTGFHGYNAQRTNKYPQGQPNAMIARSIESGTSFRQKHPFVAPAIRKNRKQAEQAMKTHIEKALKEYYGG